MTLPSTSEALEAMGRYQGFGLLPFALYPGTRDKPTGPWGELTGQETVEEWTEYLSPLSSVNVAIATGAKGRIVAVDVEGEQHGGIDGWQSLTRFLGGEPPATWTARTARGGLHLYYRRPPGTAWLKGAVKVLPGVDLRADGNYVVAPPSVIQPTGDHPGGEYSWIRAPWDFPLAECPAWVVELASRTPQPTETATSGRCAPRTDWAAVARETCREGGRNDTAARLAGHLAARDATPAGEREALRLLLNWSLERCRPPLDDREVTAVVTSIFRRERRNPAWTLVPVAQGEAAKAFRGLPKNVRRRLVMEPDHADLKNAMKRVSPAVLLTVLAAIRGNEAEARRLLAKAYR